jgi:hypothetical protein
MLGVCVARNEQLEREVEVTVGMYVLFLYRVRLLI